MADAARSLNIFLPKKKAGSFLTPPQANEKETNIISAFELDPYLSRPGSNSIAEIT